jgi:hypothetical protein
MPTNQSDEQVLALRRIYHEVGHAIVADDFRVAIKGIDVSETTHSHASYANWPRETPAFKRPAPWIVVDGIIAVAGAVAEVMLLDHLDGVNVTQTYVRLWRSEECGQAADLEATEGYIKDMLADRSVTVEAASMPSFIILMQDQWAWIARGILMRRWQDVHAVAATFNTQYGSIDNAQFNTALGRA